MMMRANTIIRIGLMILLALAVGCAAKSRNHHDGHVRIYTPEGAMIFDSKSIGYAYAESAASPSGETVAVVGHSGAKSVAPAVHKPDPIDWIAKNSKTLYVIGSLLAAAGAVVAAVLPRYRVAGIAVGLVGGGVIFAPTVMDAAEPLIVPVIVIAIIGAGLWLYSVVVRRREEAARAKAAAAEIKQGLDDEDPARVRAGVAIARTVNPALDKGFEAIR